MSDRLGSLEALTEALQELEERRKQGIPSIKLPKIINLQKFLSPEIDKFLEQRRAYRERTKDISVGEYCFA